MEGRVVASFAYDDGTDKIIARVFRIEPGRDGRGKNFLPYRVDGKETASKPGLDGLQLPLYHRSEVLLAAREFRTIFLVEGEGKADLLRASLAESRTSGAVTTVPHGANARMRDAHVADFVGAGRVIVVADSDTVGRAAARTRARLIARAHQTTEVRLVDLFPDRDNGDPAMMIASASPDKGKPTSIGPMIG